MDYTALCLRRLNSSYQRILDLTKYLWSNQGTVPAFTWKDLGKQQTPSFGIAGFLTEPLLNVRRITPLLTHFRCYTVKSQLFIVSVLPEFGKD
jgi:hypothetical protein